MIEPLTTHAKIELPARPQYLHVLRSVLASVAVGLEFSIEKIEDLKMAVVEASNQLLAAGAPGLPLVVVAYRRADGLQLEVSVDGVNAAWPPAGNEESLTFRVLTTVATDVSYGRSQERAYVRLSIGRDPGEPNDSPETSA